MLTPAGDAVCRSIVTARDAAVARAMAALTEVEQATFGALAEKVLRAFVVDLDHAYAVCRLCNSEACADCPVDAELIRREAKATTG